MLGNLYYYRGMLSWGGYRYVYKVEGNDAMVMYIDKEMNCVRTNKEFIPRHYEFVDSIPEILGLPLNDMHAYLRTITRML